MPRLPLSRRRRGRTPSRPYLEPMESRFLPTTITVNSAADPDARDDGLTLREAIEVANGTLAVDDLTAQEQAQVSGALASPNAIAFHIPGAGVHTITPLTSLPQITDPVIIDGYTQPGSRPNTNPVTTGINAVPLIQLSPLPGGAVSTGLTLTAGGSSVRGLVINGFLHSGIELQTNGGNTILSFANIAPRIVIA